MTPLDYIVIIAYLLFSMGIGFYGGAEKAKTASEYFTDSNSKKGKVYEILVGLSIMATFFSGLSFILYPSITYTSGIMVLWGLVSFPICWIVLYYWFWPRFLASPPNHPFEVIQRQYGASIRFYASILFILLRIGWMSSLIYVPALMILATTGLGEGWFWPIILIIGISCTIYTTVGGLRGVILTDAMQFLVIFGGLLAVFIYVAIHLPVSPGVAWESLKDSGTMNLMDFHFSWVDSITFWSIIIGFSIPSFSAYLGDPMALSRYISLGNLKDINRSFCFNVFGAIGVVCLLILCGLSIKLWYGTVPDPQLPSNPDEIFPYFVASQLPIGMAGLLVAAILAATMSSVTSGINALAGTATNDFVRLLKPEMKEDKLLVIGKTLSVIIGIGATIAAGFVENLGTIFDITRKLLGVFAGPLFVPMVLALMKVPCPPFSIILGGLSGLCVGWYVSFTDLSSLWVSAFALVPSILVPAVSLVFLKTRTSIAS